MLRRHRAKTFAFLLGAGSLAAGVVVIWMLSSRATHPISGTTGGGDVYTHARNAEDCLAQARAFTDYPLVWAGPSVLGYELTSCDHMMTKTRYAPDGRVSHPGGDSWSFAYGTCVTRKGQESCPLPVGIIVDPCALTVDGQAIPEGSTPVRSMTVRGAKADVSRDGVLTFEQSPQIIEIYAPEGPPDERAANAVKIAEALIPANELAEPLSRGAPLTTAFAADPDTLCRNSFVPAPPATAEASPAPTDTPRAAGNAIVLDAAPGAAGVQTDATVAGGDAFPIEITVASVGPTPYKGYQWEIAFDGGGLAFADNVREHTAQTGLDSCTAPVASSFAPDPGFPVLGAAGCLSLSEGPGTSYTGAVTTLDMRCLQNGTFTILLIDLQHDPTSGTTLIDAPGASIATKTNGITITCQVSPNGQASATP